MGVPWGMRHPGGQFGALQAIRGHVILSEIVPKVAIVRLKLEHSSAHTFESIRPELSSRGGTGANDKTGQAGKCNLKGKGALDLTGGKLAGHLDERTGEER